MHIPNYFIDFNAILILQTVLKNINYFYVFLKIKKIK